MAAPSDWQLGCTEMKQRGSHLLQSGQWSDCTFLVGSEPHQVIINGHKLILAMASPVFEAMFYGGMAERDEPIQILDVQPDAFKALLEYIYTDNINISSFDKACELCYGAKKYMLPHLVKECTKYLWSDLYPRNACRAYEFARLFEENVLMDKCMQIISTNTKEVLTDPSFEEVDISTVITVFSLDHLNVDSELDLFDAAVRYSKAQDKRFERSISPVPERPSPGPSTSKEKVVNIESSAENSPVCMMEGCKASEGEQQTEQVMSEAVSDTADSQQSKKDDKPESSGENTTDCMMEGTKGTEESQQAGQDMPEEQTRKEDKPDTKSRIRPAIEKIRFLTLTPQQFAEGPARSSLLTESEAFAVLMNILSSNSDVPMPEGFSTCRVPRKQLIGGNSNNMPTFTVDTPSPVTVEQVFGALERPANPQPCHLQYPRPARHDGKRNRDYSDIITGINGQTSGLGKRNRYYSDIITGINSQTSGLGKRNPEHFHISITETVETSGLGEINPDYSDIITGINGQTSGLGERYPDYSDIITGINGQTSGLGARISTIHGGASIPSVSVHPSISGSSLGPLGGLGNPLGHLGDGMGNPRGETRLYAARAVAQQTDCLNTSVLDCSVTFMVDKNICLLGVQVPTQAPSEESAVSSMSGSSGYSELLYAHLLDSDGARLTYTHYTNRVPYRHLLDIMFNRPVYIQRNKVYKVGIVFNKVGWYPLGAGGLQAQAEGVFFTFCIGHSADSVRDGLIRSIIFTY